MYYIEVLYSNYFLDDYVYIYVKFFGLNFMKLLDSDVLVFYLKGIFGNVGLVVKMKFLYYMFM